jgi:hypothetical protein
MQTDRQTDRQIDSIPKTALSDSKELRTYISLEISRYYRVYSHCYATTARWANILDPFLSNSSENTFPLLGSRFLITQQLDFNNGREGFLRGPCREVVSETKFRAYFSCETVASLEWREHVKLKNLQC